MTHSTRRFFPFAAAISVALALTACGGDEPPKAEPATVTVTDTPTAEEASAPEQQELTAAQITKALPTKEEAPDGFPEDPSGFTTKGVSKVTTDPTSCLALYLDTPKMRTFEKEHLSEADGVRYTQAGDAAGRPSISVAIWTYDDPYPQAFVDEAGASMSECTTFDKIDEPGDEPAKQSAKTITTPTVGDQSFGVRIGYPDIDIAIDYLWIRSGHNLINVRMLTGFRQDNAEILEKYGKGVLEDLAKG